MYIWEERRHIPAIDSALKRISYKYKEIAELSYWKVKHIKEKILSNTHYKHYFTTYFGIDETYYKNKVILDIGCGPRGSLEWAKMAKSRIGLDPLASSYRKLGTKRHEMIYINSYSENIPLRRGKCNVVSSFNSLDHVNDVRRTIREIKRVTSSEGLFLLIVEVNHIPRICEPHRISPNELIELLKPEFNCNKLTVYKPVTRGVYTSIRKNVMYEKPEHVNSKGYMSACFIRK